MYKEFYGLTAYPFALTPDTQFFYLSKNHEYCLRAIFQALEQEQSRIVLLGESGTGKTLVLSTLVQCLDKDIRVVGFAHSDTDSLAIAESASDEAPLAIRGASPAKLIFNIKNFVLTCAPKNKKVLLIIDEAHNLSSDVLEELLLLDQLNTPEKKRLQMIFAGHPAFEQMLKAPDLLPCSKRLDTICYLYPMDYDETKHYIEKRLHIAGATYAIFPPSTIKKIFACSQGIPRLVNLICNSALSCGFGYEKTTIGDAIIQQVIQELHVYIPASLPADSLAPSYGLNGTHSPDVASEQLLQALEDGSALAPQPRRSRARSVWRLGVLIGVIGVSLLATAFVLRTALPGGKAGESLSGTVSPPPVGPGSGPGWREQPLLPHGTGWREQPLLPHGTGWRGQSRGVQWSQSLTTYQLPVGRPASIALPVLQRFPAEVPVTVTLEHAAALPRWLTFHAEHLLFSGTPPLQEAGKTYTVIVRAHTADGMESRLQMLLSLVAQGRR
ncbi:MAG: AAA family ATPase [Candidatus Tectimicrobiota bacterium]